MTDAPTLMFSRVKTIKAGKVAHRCIYCRKMIEVGQPKVKLVMMDDESKKPDTTYSHPACELGYEEEL